jgi:glycosyltransferase involved in cell wall biosynthesis
MTKRLSLCYVAPGHALLSTSGTTRNMLSLAAALSQWADVTVAFRNSREAITTEKFQVITIEPQIKSSDQVQDDVAARGLNPFPHLSYLHTLRGFARQWASSFDVVLEKGWRLSGWLLAAFRRQGVSGVLVENDVRYWSEPLRDFRTIARYMLHKTAHGLTGFSSRRVPLIIAETRELKTMLVQQRGIAPERIEVIGLGVDHALFHPMDQMVVRQALGMGRDTHMLLYVGGMDVYHDLGPVLDALAQVRGPSLELHLVGDGEYRMQYEAKARQAHMPVRFYGHVPHDRIPEFIAAADVCLAPYQPRAFHHGLVPFSTLKIPEYMACGRPVISIPSGHIQTLIEDQITGFLFPNDVAAWRTFLEALPTRQRLEDMGRAAAQAVASLSWERTAARYLEVSQRLIATLNRQGTRS